MPKQGPVEAFITRVHELRGAAGCNTGTGQATEAVVRPAWTRWALAGGEVEQSTASRLSRDEEDMLGHALVAHDRGALTEAQGYLDMLWHHHQLRLGLQQSISDGIMTSSAAYVSDNDDTNA